MSTPTKACAGGTGTRASTLNTGIPASRAAATADVMPSGSMATTIDPLGGGLADETRISVRDPALRQLARSGKLAVEADAGQFELSANPAERRLISDFFAYCGSDRV